MVRTIKAREVKVKPITQPALKATLKASSKLLYAVKATLVLVYVAIYMPMNPEIIEVKAPTMNAIVVYS